MSRAAAFGLGGVITAMALATFAEGHTFRPPSIPLITHDPYLSCWSASDRLFDDWPRHWTGRVHAMCGIVRVDGKAMRFMGIPGEVKETVTQKSVEVEPTQTVYVFQCGGVDMKVTFTSPLLPDDLDLLSRPLSYVTIGVTSNDGQTHSIQVYFDATAEWAVNDVEQEVQWSRLAVDGLDAMRIGTVEQKTLERVGDDVRIDWGHFIVAVPKTDSARSVMTFADDARGTFAKSGGLPDKDDGNMPRAAKDRWPVLAVAWDFGQVARDTATRRLLVAYDDEYSIEYMGNRLRPWWRRDNAMTAETMLSYAYADCEGILQRCNAFDEALVRDATALGGENYARLCALSYRQAIAANKLVADLDGEPLLFPKENFSNGCIGTVDVIYPMAPLFLLTSPELARAMMRPVLDYASSPRWKWPFAPHDVGTYPRANGQVYGGGEKTEKNQMPVEESGNMILLLAALAKIEGNAAFAEIYWPQITKWAEYLREKGLDPENQLCTDDFAGHLAHNVNLSAKAILALAAYGRLCDMTGRKDEAAAYGKLAQDFATQWARMADDGDHYRLAFDKPNTWSQKYNLVWDRILGLNLFPRDVTQKEIAYYEKVQNKYGLPLDNRKDYTKLDWVLWTATLVSAREDFDALLAPVITFINETPDRVPLTDWYDTMTANKIGFQARPVIGGVFIKFLADEALWAKWSRPGNS